MNRQTNKNNNKLTNRQGIRIQVDARKTGLARMEETNATNK